MPDRAVTVLPPDANLEVLVWRVLGSRRARDIAIVAPAASHPGEEHGAALRRCVRRVAVDLAHQDVPLGRRGAGGQRDGDGGAGGVRGRAEVDVHVVAGRGAADAWVGSPGGISGEDLLVLCWDKSYVTELSAVVVVASESVQTPVAAVWPRTKVS